jgi:hypothetical protein
MTGMSREDLLSAIGDADAKDSENSNVGDKNGGTSETLMNNSQDNMFND